IGSEIDTQGEGVPVVLFNPLSWERDDVAECRVGFSEKDVFEVEVRDSAGHRMASDLLACERYETGGIKRATVLFIARNVPALGYEVYHVLPSTTEPPPSPLHSNQPNFIMADVHRDLTENDEYRVESDAGQGEIRRRSHNT